MFEAELFKLFALVMVRFSGLMVSAPILGSGNIPVRLKVGLVALFSIIVTPLLPALESGLPVEAVPFALMAAGEFLIGLLIGFVMTLVFTSVQIGGQLMDYQTGFGMMNVFNPAMETQFPIFGFFLFIVAVLFMLVTGGHRVMIWALYCTYEHVPLGGFVARPEMLWQVTDWGAMMFLDGLMIAAPVAAAMLVAYITMGLLGKVIPQIHLFVVGFPVTIATGFFMIAAILGVYMILLEGMFDRWYEQLDSLIQSMGVV